MKTMMKDKFDPHIKALKSEFTRLIRERLGIVMHTHQNYELFKTIQEACKRFACTPEEYLHHLITDPDQSILLDHLVSGITVGETYFFRDQQQMQLLEQHLLPQIIKNKRETNSLSLRIWSAGCATGEEIYTVAMMLMELIPDINKWTIKLLATDINTIALQKALVGVYGEWSMRSITDYYKKKYFKKDERYYFLSEEIKKLVNFEYLNLNEDNYPSIFNGTNAQDLIICRNVLIYIDNTSCVRLMKKMNKSLLYGGYLMLGASDPINIAETDFIFHHRKGLLFSRPNVEIPTVDLVPDIKKEPKRVEKIFVPKPPKKITQKILEVKEAPVQDDLIIKAMELADLGKLKEALSVCEDAFKLDPTNKLTYFIYGLTLCELNKFTEAEAAFRKSLFLDNQFVLGHFQLGLLLMRLNKNEAGLKSLKNALNIAEANVSEEAVPGSPGLSYERLAEILRNEINLHVKSES